VRKIPNRNLIFIYSGIFLVLTMVFMYVLFNGMVNRETIDELTTSEFRNAVTAGDVLEVTYNVSDAQLSGLYLKDGETDPERATKFESKYVGADSLNELMAEYPDVKYSLDTSNNNMLMQLLPTLLMFAVLGGLIWFMFNRIETSNNRQMQFGRSKARRAHEERPSTKFADVAGIDEVVEELQEIKDFLANPEPYRKFGAKIPRGVLLVGPPGTGKTLIARAVAGEAGVPFFSISGSDFVEMFVGVGASRVRDLFEQAKAAAPAIIFVDEIDAVGRQRGAGLGGGHDEREQTLNQLLVEMDGFEDHQAVILIAATNRPDILDPALLRPGRFDRQIVVMRPDLKGREAILKVHSADKPLAHSVDLETVAKMTPGFTGADLANLMNEAALLAARRKLKLITMNELSEAMERSIAGPERKSRIMTDKEKRIIAYHEVGHALVGHLLENSDPVHKISIISRGQALGYTLLLPEEDRFLSSRNEMLDSLAVSLGGRVAEELYCDDITTGASNDLERATSIAKQMVTRYGMTEALGHTVYGQAQHEVFLGRDYSSSPDYSDETARRIDVEVSRIMMSAHEVATKLLSTRKAQIEQMVSVLIERETVDSEALDALLNNTWDTYLGEEQQILARKAAELRKQEQDDARRAAQAERERELEERRLAALEATDHEASEASNPPKLNDIIKGNVNIDDVMKHYLKSWSDDAPPPAGSKLPPGEVPPPAGAMLPPEDAPPPVGAMLPPEDAPPPVGVMLPPSEMPPPMGAKLPSSEVPPPAGTAQPQGFNPSESDQSLNEQSTAVNSEAETPREDNE
jgi:cell division protease FtsH